MKNNWKKIVLILFGVLFISGFFFLDSGEVLYNQEKEEEVEVSTGQQKNIMSYIEIAKFKFHNLTMSEDYPNPEDMTKEEIEDYLSNYFSDPILSKLTAYWSGESDEVDGLVNRFLSLSSEIEGAEYVPLEDQEVRVNWFDEYQSIDVFLFVEKSGNGWVITDIDFK
ncbi:hypothetical protein JOC95_000227 [Bacillus tianshenii]|uniref:DUF3828 domain-containing protein n=1 Tax=Sutcliffiella tianshenii TaxID=1463404 RepID=A0ABS2NUQ5_9BACI|nr:hypothetical protein [Bacillus tianshenii]MBM7618385.1 hypothetical protein [Bacillus tianshenii]